MTKFYVKKYIDGLIENIYSTNFDNKITNIEPKAIIDILHNFEYKIKDCNYQIVVSETEYDGFTTETRIFFNNVNDIEKWTYSEEKYCLEHYVRSILKRCIYSVNRDKDMPIMIMCCSAVDFSQKEQVFMAELQGKDKVYIDVALPYPKTIATMELFNDIYQLDLSIEEEDDLKYLIDRFNIIDCDCLTDNSRYAIKKQYGIPSADPIPYHKLLSI